MKIQLDTNAKTIKIEEAVNLGDLQQMLEKLLPDNQWKEYKLETSVIHNYSNPIIIERHVPRVYPWWHTQYLQSGTGLSQSTTTINNKGIYNLKAN